MLLEDYHELPRLAALLGRHIPPQLWVDELVAAAGAASHEAAGPG